MTYFFIFLGSNPKETKNYYVDINELPSKLGHFEQQEIVDYAAGIEKKTFYRKPNSAHRLVLVNLKSLKECIKIRLKRNLDKASTTCQQPLKTNKKTTLISNGQKVSDIYFISKCIKQKQTTRIYQRSSQLVTIFDIFLLFVTHIKKYLNPSVSELRGNQ